MKRKLAKHGKKVLPGIWQLNRTTFVVRAQPIDPRTGKKRNLRRLLERSTLAAAIREREALMESVHKRPKTLMRQETVADFVTSWLRYKAERGDIEQSTLERYTTALGHLSNTILESYLDEVTVGDIERWMVKATQKKRGRRPERFEPSTVNSWLRILRTLLNDACRLRGLRFNAATAVRPLIESHNLEEMNSLDAEDLMKLLDALRGTDAPLLMAACTQACTGLRWGEVSALKWEDLNVERRLLWIRRKVQKGKLLPSTKTKQIRRVGLPKELLESLLAYRLQLTTVQKASGLMFPSTVGKPIWNSRITKALRKARAEAGITQRFTSHGFRRSLTDLLREATVDPVVAKAITGHSTDRMRQHYSTVRDSDLQRAGDATGALLAPALRLIDGGKSSGSGPVTSKESTEESTAPDGTKTTGEASASTGRNL